MIRYVLYDEYGDKQHVEEQQACTCATVILEHQGKFYRPIQYDLNAEPHIAKCVPVEVIKCGRSESHAKVSERVSSRGQ